MTWKTYGDASDKEGSEVNVTSRANDRKGYEIWKAKCGAFRIWKDTLFGFLNYGTFKAVRRSRLAEAKRYFCSQFIRDKHVLEKGA